MLQSVLFALPKQLLLLCRVELLDQILSFSLKGQNEGTFFLLKLSSLVLRPHFQILFSLLKLLLATLYLLEVVQQGRCRVLLVVVAGKIRRLVRIHHHGTRGRTIRRSQRNGSSSRSKNERRRRRWWLVSQQNVLFVRELGKRFRRDSLVRRRR